MHACTALSTQSFKIQNPPCTALGATQVPHMFHPKLHSLCSQLLALTLRSLLSPSRFHAQTLSLPHAETRLSILPHAETRLPCPKHCKTQPRSGSGKRFWNKAGFRTGVPKTTFPWKKPGEPSPKTKNKTRLCYL